MTPPKAELLPARRLIEEWLPIAALGEESRRERRSMTALPPTYYLHVWFARRPLVASRAAILASLLPADASHADFLHAIGIHGDPVASAVRIAEAKASGERFEGEAYTYSRAFTYLPELSDLAALGLVTDKNSVLDPTAGGGSVPFEAIRLGCTTIGNDLNPVAMLILKATCELPAKHGSELHSRFNEIAKRFIGLRDAQLQQFFPPELNPKAYATNWIWARTVSCPYCGGIVPLSPNWRLNSEGTGLRLTPDSTGGSRRIRFEIVHRVADQGARTVKDGTGLCPFSDCNRTIDRKEIKRQAQAGQMGHQLYAVVFKEEVEVPAANGRTKIKIVRGFRAPRPEDNVDSLVQEKFAAKLPDWQARNIIPDEAFPEDSNDTRPIQYGSPLWRDLFNPRQLFGHCTSVEVFHDLAEELRQQSGGELSKLDRAALVYVSFAIDKLLNYNAIQVRWHSKRGVMVGVFDRHDFSFKWSYAELPPTIAGVGYDWAFDQTGKSLRELIELSGHPKESKGPSLFTQTARPIPEIKISCGSGDSLPVPSESVDCIVMDPPYYDNVMYAELADFFYVWLKRTAGLLYPELFTSYLTDKDREAVANPAKFKGQKGGAKNLAGRDYQERMASIFKEQRRVLKPDGIMTVMFTHKAKGAWDALATGLIDAGFVITASWPINTEAEGSLHIREKNAAKSTIFLVCRQRAAATEHAEPRYWEEVEPLVASKVREKVKEFQEAGMVGVDLYLACFGPALEVFSREWPLRRGTARPEPPKRQRSLFEDPDPYAVRPEDALDAARREVKSWRLQQLTTVKRQHHLDPLTEWYLLAWDTFRAIRFDADEALKLARVIGLDFDKDVCKVVCEKKDGNVILWDARTRQNNGKLGHAGPDLMLDTLHWLAITVRDQNTGAGKSLLERAQLLDDATLKTALEAMLRVLPQNAPEPKKGAVSLAGFAADFKALESVRKLVYQGDIPPAPVQTVLALADVDDDDADEDEDDE
jgi:adenine-specific DNA methylase